MTKPTGLVQPNKTKTLRAVESSDDSLNRLVAACFISFNLLFTWMSMVLEAMMVLECENRSILQAMGMSNMYGYLRSAISVGSPITQLKRSSMARDRMK